jgi:putative ABC transport system substrate-binding protein
LGISARKLVVRRRNLVPLLVGALTVQPLWARAQQKRRPVIGFLSTLSKAQVEPQVTAFIRGLNESGFKEGSNVEIEYRFAEGQYDRLSGMAAEFVGAHVSLILAQASPAALAAMAATIDIPIVFVIAGDPVTGGLVRSLNKPGGNATGMTLISNAIGQKRLEMLVELAPKASHIAMLVNPDSPDSVADMRSVQAGAQALKLQLQPFYATSPTGIEAAFSAMKAQRPDGLLVGTDPFFLNRRQDIALRAADLAVPAIYPFRDYAVGGGLISYGTSIATSYRRAGIYAGRILKGAEPAELPVMQPISFELVINLKTAASLGLEIPATLHARADEVIE